MKFPITYALWRDATSVSEWTDYDQIDGECHLIETCGFLVKETKDTITIAGSHDPIGCTAGDYISIPKSWILERAELKYAKRKE